jgi:hypothetical protein
MGYREGWVAKLVAHPLVTEALSVRIQTLATLAKEWPTHSSPRQIIQRKLNLNKIGHCTLKTLLSLNTFQTN